MIFQKAKISVPAIIGGMVIFILTLVIAPQIKAQESKDLQWHSFEEALAVADSTQRPVFIDVWAPWCGWCRKMQREVYPNLRKQLDTEFVLSKINRDDNQTMHIYKGRKLSSVKLAQQLNTQSVPAIVVLDAQGNYILHLSGFMKAEKLRPVLVYISSKGYQAMPFDEYKY